MMTVVMSGAKEITATQFKARCLRLLDEVAETGETLVVTKRGRPVVRVEPTRPRQDLRGSVRFNISDEELVNFSMGPWDVERD
jgi:prevent-host-death family protein